MALFSIYVLFLRYPFAIVLHYKPAFLGWHNETYDNIK